jgi:hypothetical protein
VLFCGLAPAFDKKEPRVHNITNVGPAQQSDR